MNRKAARNKDEIPSGGGGGGGGGINNNNNKGTLADCINAVSSCEDKAKEGGINTTMREGMLVAFNLHNIILQDFDENDAKDVVEDNAFARENFMARAKGKVSRAANRCRRRVAHQSSR